MLASPWRRLIDSRAAPAAILGVFTALVALTIRRQVAWFDESYSLLLTGPHGFIDIARRTAVDGHPPLFYWLLKPWLSAFGVNVVAARVEQALFMLAGLAVWYRFLATRFDRALALLALALLAINPFILHFATDARMYAFGILLTGASCLAITGERRTRAHWIAYWLLAVAMLYTHYFLAFVIAGQFGWLLLRRRELGVRVIPLVVYGASIVAAFAPWLPLAAQQTTTIVGNGFWIPPVTANTPLDYITTTFLDGKGWDFQTVRMWPALAFAAAFAAAIIAAGRSRFSLAMIWLVAFAPWLFLFALSMKLPIFHPRYVGFSLPALCTLLAAGALAMRPSARALAIAGLVAGTLWGDARVRVDGYDPEHHYPLAKIEKLARAPIDGEVPLIMSTSPWLYFNVKARIPDLPNVILRDTPPECVGIDAIYCDKPDWYVTKFAQVTAAHVWLFERSEDAVMPTPPGWVEQRSQVISGQIHARLFARAPAAAAPTHP